MPTPRVLAGTDGSTHHRRGLILGLSMAEVLLILIFVLLMIFSEMLVERERKAKEFLDILAGLGLPEHISVQSENWTRVASGVAAIQKLIQVGYSDDELQRLFAAVPQFGKPGELPQDWTKAAWAAARISELEKSGADVTKLLAALQRLLSEGYTPAELNDIFGALPQFGKHGELPENWTKAAWAAEEVKKLEQDRVDVQALFANHQTILAIQQLIAAGYTHQQLRDMLGTIGQLIGKGYSAEQLRDMLVAMPLFGNPADLPRDWKRVADAAVAVSKLDKAGVNVDALVEDPATVVAVQQLVAKGYSQTQLRDMLAAATLFGKPNDFPKDWGRVARAVEAVGKLEKAGINVDKLTANIGALSAFLQLIDKGYTVDQIRDMLAPKPPPLTPPSPSPASRWPPMIPLSEAGGYHFKTYSADLTDDFRTKLHDGIAPMIDRLMRQYDVDVVEVIGNTDERPVNGSDRNPVNGSDGHPINGSNKNPVISNLDNMLLPVLRGNRLVSELKSADNTDLGMARAVAVTKELRALLPGRNVIPLSAAQMIGLSGDLSDGTQPGDVEQRRRIEIRLRHSDAGP